MSDAFETVIGLECHVELSTATKMFCGCPNTFGAAPNTNVCEVCLGHPGSLPVPNERAIEYSIRIGLALGCDVAPRSLFHRKNYFYPDMPKNFQISQYDLPLCVGGALEVEVGGELRRVGITRVHLEEDTGKTSHAGVTGRIAQADYALEDYNRAGVPLVEIVSEPDMRTPEEAAAYVRELRATLEALGVSDVRMEEGSMRCDANVSVRPAGSEGLGTKVEIKNLNSIRSVERALRFEEERQREVLGEGGSLVQETRHWDENAGRTSPLRSKEYAFDYRYFPEPDLPPVEPDPAWIEEIRASLPELPRERRARYVADLGLDPRRAAALTASRDLGELFEETRGLLPAVEPGVVANWITQNVAALVNEGGVTIEDARGQAKDVARVVELVADGSISATAGKEVLAESLAGRRSPDDIVEERGLRQVSDEGALGPVIDEVIAENPGPVEQFLAGKEGVLGFLVGQVMKRTRGAANPRLVQDLLRRRLGGG
jgi:aspartyl-tRNA(Asn)/glutamyl-tRNA(Gln) amidotransferase subunit B